MADKNQFANLSIVESVIKKREVHSDATKWFALGLVIVKIRIYVLQRCPERAICALSMTAGLSLICLRCTRISRKKGRDQFQDGADF